MAERKTIIAISGSTRRLSTNLHLIQAIIGLYQDRLDIEVFQHLADLPHFNPDLDTDNPPPAVASLRQQLHDADGILICTPEYAMGVPGTLKNAIDWTVSSMEFSHKPVALITASSSGEKGHRALMESLKVLEAELPDSSQLVISFAGTKIKDGKITDGDTLSRVIRVMDSLIKNIDERTREDRGKIEPSISLDSGSGLMRNRVDVLEDVCVGKKVVPRRSPTTW